MEILKTIILILFAIAVLFAQEKPVTHVVLCWMDSTTTPNLIDSLVEESRMLGSLPGIMSFHVGKPVPSDRPIVDDSFRFGLTMKFDNVDSMNRYLVAPRHSRFIAERIQPHLLKIVVYDMY